MSQVTGTNTRQVCVGSSVNLGFKGLAIVTR